MGFPTKNYHFGVFWGYHNLRKHPYHDPLKTRVPDLYVFVNLYGHGQTQRRTVDSSGSTPQYRSDTGSVSKTSGSVGWWEGGLVDDCWLGGGFKYLLCSSLFGEMIQFD